MNNEALGTKENPHVIAPDDWEDNGLEYGAFCRCSECGLIARSTVLFDYYTLDGPGSPLACETCRIGTPHELIKPVIDLMESEGAFQHE